MEIGVLNVDVEIEPSDSGELAVGNIAEGSPASETPNEASAKAELCKNLGSVCVCYFFPEGCKPGAKDESEQTTAEQPSDEAPTTVGTPSPEAKVSDGQSSFQKISVAEEKAEKESTARRQSPEVDRDQEPTYLERLLDDGVDIVIVDSLGADRLSVYDDNSQQKAEATSVTEGAGGDNTVNTGAANKTVTDLPMPKEQIFNKRTIVAEKPEEQAIFSELERNFQMLDGFIDKHNVDRLAHEDNSQQKAETIPVIKGDVGGNTANDNIVKKAVVNPPTPKEAPVNRITTATKKPEERAVIGESKQADGGEILATAPSKKPTLAEVTPVFEEIASDFVEVVAQEQLVKMIVEEDTPGVVGEEVVREVHDDELSELKLITNEPDFPQEDYDGLLDPHKIPAAPDLPSSQSAQSDPEPDEILCGSSLLIDDEDVVSPKLRSSGFSAAMSNRSIDDLVRRLAVLVFCRLIKS